MCGLLDPGLRSLCFIFFQTDSLNPDDDSSDEGSDVVEGFDEKSDEQSDVVEGSNEKSDVFTTFLALCQKIHFCFFVFSFVDFCFVALCIGERLFAD